ncbi:MAG: O-antigen ligase family protein [Acidimicrobiia bacterium]
MTADLAMPVVAGSLALGVALGALVLATGRAPVLLIAAVLVAPVLVCGGVALVLRPQRGVLLLAALLPFDGLQQILGFPAGWKEALTLVVLGATFVAPFAARSPGRRDLPQWAYLVIGLAALGLVSAVLVGGSRGLVGLKVGFFYVLLGLAVWRCPLDGRERDRLVTILMATGFATAVFGLVQQLLGPDRLADLGYEFNTDIRTAGGFLRSFSTFDTSFAFALYLMVVVLVGLAVAIGAPRRLRNQLFFLSLPVILAAMAVAITRVAFLGLAAGIAYLAIAKYRSLVIVFIDGVVIAAVLLAVAASFSGAFLSTSSSEARFDLWDENFAEIAAHPFGAGVGATGAAAEKAAEVAGSDEEIFQPDNYYFKLAYELGVIGLWLFALFLVAAATSTHRAARRLTGTDAAFASGVTACIIAAALSSVVATYFEIFPLDAYFWLLLAVVAACVSESR